MMIIDGKNQPNTFNAARYKECIPAATKAREVTSGRTYNLSADTTLNLAPRPTLILEY